MPLVRSSIAVKYIFTFELLVIPENVLVATGHGVEFNKDVRFCKYKEAAVGDEKTYFVNTIVEGKEVVFLVRNTSVQIKFIPLEKR